MITWFPILDPPGPGRKKKKREKKLQPYSPLKRSPAQEVGDIIVGTTAALGAGLLIMALGFFFGKCS